jgi:hypothetical protein
MADKQAKSPSEELGFVRYIGLATDRGILRSDVSPLGLDMPEDLWWRRDNQYLVRRSDIPDEVYARAIAPDPEFVLLSPNAGQEQKG